MSIDPSHNSQQPSRWLLLWRAVYPPVLGIVVVGLLYCALFGVDFLLGADLRLYGVGDAATEQRVMSRYGRTLLLHQGRVLACYAAIGAGLGLLIQLCITLWERTSTWPGRKNRPRSLETPLSLPPSPWPLGRRLLVSALAALTLHVFLLSRAIILRPALFAETLYDRGGFGRTVMVWLTHGTGGLLLWMLGVGFLLFLLMAPLLSLRARRFFGELWLWHRPWLLALCAVTTLGLVYWQWPASPPQQAAGARRPPSLLIIAVDSLRADRLFEDRRGVAPAMTELAARSVRLTQAHVSVPRTFPSFVTLLTGRYPYHHGIRTMFPTHKERAAVPIALPQLLKDRGYQTAVVSDFCGEIFSRIDLGFDRVEVPSFDARALVLQRGVTVHRNLLPYLSGAGFGSLGLALGQRVFPELEGVSELADPKLLAARALRTIAQHSRTDAPFFLTVFFSTAHFPYAAPAPYYRRFMDPSYRGPFLYHKPPLTDVSSPADVAAVQALYDGSVAAADAGVKALLDGLAALGRAEDTIVVLLSDHGENLYDEPGRGMGHGDHLEGNQSLRVPVLIHDPVHRFPPHAVTGLTRDIDLVPTLLALLGQPADAALRSQLDGVDLGPLLRGDQASLGLTSVAETELWFTPTGPGFATDQRLPYPDVTSTTDISPDDDIAVRERYRDLVTVAKHRALRTDRYKIIYRPTRNGPRYSVYDVVQDPREVHDLVTEQPALLAQLQAALFAALASDPTVEITGDFILPR
ncbi:MAG: sulfatase-like hydrolase/transferase [Deltaproteobacteria bacterium]|nr:sulfatase-like hydrolase/transferase [Deltaproteobacteria bacterium]